MNTETKKHSQRITAVRLFALVLALLCVPSLHAGLFGPKGDNPEEKKATVRQQRDEMLADLFASNPGLKEALPKAVGYATFKNTNVNLLLLATANGYGMAVDNRTGQETFMRMASLGGGIGAGLKDMRVIFVFNDEKVMRQFIDEGWQFGGKADAAAKYKKTGVAGEQDVKANVSVKEANISGGSSTEIAGGVNSQNSEAARISPTTDMQVFQFTESGIALQATVQGTKYWKDSKLNE